MVFHVIVQYNGGFLPGILLLTQAPIFVLLWFDDTNIVYYYYYYHTLVTILLHCLLFRYVDGHVAINLSVQLYNSGLLPDILLLTRGYNHRGTRLNAMYVQWWLRFKRGVCHAKETSLRSDYIGFRVPVAGINSAGRDALVVVTNRSVQRAFYMFYTISLCVTGPTPSAIPPHCVRYSSSRENRFLPWSQSYSIISIQPPTTQRERYVSVTHLTSRKLVCESDSNQQLCNSHYP